MVARERMSNENNFYFILLSIPRENQSVKKFFLKARWNVTVTNSFENGAKTYGVKTLTKD